MISALSTRLNYEQAVVEDTGYNDWVFHAIEPGPHRIIDLGCGSGALGDQLLRHNKAGEVVGLDINPAAIERAQERLTAAHVFNVETDTISCEYQHRFDGVILTDIIEHVVNPALLLERCRSLLTPSGKIYFSIPNVQHALILVHLLIGRFSYADQGLLDKTHLRFFTLESIQELFRENGFRFRKLDGLVYSPLKAARFWHPNQLDPALTDQIETLYQAYTNNLDCQPLATRLLGHWSFTPEWLRNLLTVQYVGVVQPADTGETMA